MSALSRQLVATSCNRPEAVVENEPTLLMAHQVSTPEANSGFAILLREGATRLSPTRPTV